MEGLGCCGQSRKVSQQQSVISHDKGFIDRKWTMIVERILGAFVVRMRVRVGVGILVVGKDLRVAKGAKRKTRRTSRVDRGEGHSGQRGPRIVILLQCLAVTKK